MDTGFGNEGIATLCDALVIPIATDGHRVQPMGLTAPRPSQVADGYGKAKSTEVADDAVVDGLGDLRPPAVAATEVGNCWVALIIH